MNAPSTYQNKKNEDDKRPVCRYGTNCYQKNPSHRRKFKHPTPEKTGPVKESPAKKRKAPDNEDSTANDTPQTKKQSVSPEETQKTDQVSNSKEEQTDKVSSSSEKQTEIVPDSRKEETKEDSGKEETKEDSSKEETKEDSSKEEKVVDSTKQQNNKIVEAPKESPKKVESSNNLVKNEDPYSEAAKLIRKIYLVNMPKDFYKFYDFCKETRHSDPTNVFKIADLRLVGPYDVLAGEITSDTPDQDNLLMHWRYYYDPPEFQTIVKGNDKEGLHFGYWRDRPSSDPVFVATNLMNVSHKIKPVAENIFGAVTNYLEEKVKKANPFEKTSYNNLIAKLKAFAKKHDILLEAQTPKMKAREKNVVARTIHGAGIVCPYNKKTQVGYRELSVTDNQLLKIIKKIEDAATEDDRAGPRAELGEVVRLATIAGDECDFGTCLELGHDLFSTGCTLVHNAALAVLSIAYSQLERTEFLKIFEAHMKDRKKGCNCSLLPQRKNIQLS